MSGLRLTIRLDFNGKPLIGHGKVRLLEQLNETGSISAAARVLGMSYRRAWLLVEAMNQSFASPLVLARPGGGGGAILSETGIKVLRTYREIEDIASNSNARLKADLETLLNKDGDVTP